MNFLFPFLYFYLCVYKGKKKKGGRGERCKGSWKRKNWKYFICTFFLGKEQEYLNKCCKPFIWEWHAISHCPARQLPPLCNHFCCFWEHTGCFGFQSEKAGLLSLEQMQKGGNGISAAALVTSHQKNPVPRCFVLPYPQALRGMKGSLQLHCSPRLGLKGDLFNLFEMGCVQLKQPL